MRLIIKSLPARLQKHIVTINHEKSKAEQKRSDPIPRFDLLSGCKIM